MADQSARLFVVGQPPPRPAIAVHVNFGVFAGREVTPAEIDDLADWLRDEVPSVSVISEQRHEIGGGAKAVVHVVRVELSEAEAAAAGEEREILERRIFDRVRYWQQRCIAERHSTLVDPL